MVKKELDRMKLHLLRYWFLSCQDFQEPVGGCEKECAMFQECKKLRVRLFGKRASHVANCKEVKE